ncbi:MAG TPA: hypothetical protein VJH24_02965 [Candidatus Bilamarchaeaceae archaeon]|nr:hypothetical protein [Candidatus Bilamarchaeaceae archaeon]
MQTTREKARKTVDAFFSGKAEEPAKGYGQKVSELRGYLGQSVLVERFTITQKTENAISVSSANVYYGINVSPFEPLDQLDSMLVSRRVGQILGNDLIVLIAGRFGILNSMGGTDIAIRSELLHSRELQKMAYIKAAMKQFSIKGDVILTDDLWKDEYYWQIVGQLYQNRDKLPPQRQFRALDEIVNLSSIPRTLLGSIPDEVFEMMADEKATVLYAVAEIAEAIYLREFASSIIKIGPRREEEYDAYIRNALDTIHLFQPVDLRSIPEKPRTVVPYIMREGEERSRITLTDSLSDIEGKLQKANEEPQPLFYADTINPLLRILAYIHEAETILGIEAKTAQSIIGRELNASSLRVDETQQRDIYSRLRESTREMAGLIHDLIIAPIKESIGYEKNENTP